MRKLNFFIYRPDRMQSRKINPDLCYTVDDRPLSEFQRDEQTAYDYRVKKIKEKIDGIPEYKVFDWWR